MAIHKGFGSEQKSGKRLGSIGLFSELDTVLRDRDGGRLFCVRQNQPG